MRRFFVALLLSVLVLASAEECRAQFSKLSFGDYGISSIRPESFRSVRGAVWLDVNNPMQGFTLTEITGTVYKKGKPFIYGNANDFYVRSGSSKCDISGRAGLCEGVSLWAVLALLTFDPDDYSVDLSVRITLDSGETRVASKKNMPVRELLKLI